MARNINNLKDVGRIPQLSYSADAQAIRNANAGLSWSPIGALSTAVKVGQATPVMLYNNSSSVAYVTFGTSTVVAGTTPATAIPLLPNSTTVFSTGPNDYVIASASTVFGYVADQDLT